MEKVTKWMQRKPSFQMNLHKWRRCVHDLIQRKELLVYMRYAEHALSPDEQELWKQEMQVVQHEEAKCQALFDKLLTSRVSE